MAKFAKTQVTRKPTSPLVASEPTQTHEGGAAYAGDAKTALFTLAATNMVREDTFYESAKSRDTRFVDLIHEVTSEDPAWMAGFIPFLREQMFMRSAAIVAAAEFAHAALAEGLYPHGATEESKQLPAIRKVVASACQRPDEPAELLAYWVATYGRRIPQPVKRGLADAARRLYTPRNALRYDGQSRDWRMADVIELTHTRPSDRAAGANYAQQTDQSTLFKWLLDRRHNRPDVGTLGYWGSGEDEVQAMAERRYMAPVIGWERLQRVPVEQRRDLLDDADAMSWLPSWEMLAGWLQGPMDRQAWEAVIPSMGYMALLRNLRNFDEAGVSDDIADRVAAKLTDPDEVARSRQFPYRFWSAYKNAPSDRWSRALSKAADLSCRNIPALGGRTLVVIDVSGSMDSPVSNRSKIHRWEVGAVFAGAMARVCEKVDLVCFGHTNEKLAISPTASIPRYVQAVEKTVASGHLGHATFGHTAIREHYAGHDRVVLFTDDQMHDSVEFATATDVGNDFLRRAVSQRFGLNGADISHVPLMYTVDLGGYGRQSTEWGQGGRYGLAGFSDAGFRLMHLIETQRDGAWPWEVHSS